MRFSDVCYDVKLVKGPAWTASRNFPSKRCENSIDVRLQIHQYRFQTQADSSIPGIAGTSTCSSNDRTMRGRVLPLSARHTDLPREREGYPAVEIDIAQWPLMSVSLYIAVLHDGCVRSRQIGHLWNCVTTRIS